MGADAPRSSSYDIILFSCHSVLSCFILFFQHLAVKLNHTLFLMDADDNTGVIIIKF